jgi:protein-tyrosine phosphatase
MKSRGIAESTPLRSPRDVTDDDFQRASLVIALKQAEHEPMIRSRFPERLGQVRFWNIDDVPDAAPEVALPQIEARVIALLRELDGEQA